MLFIGVISGLSLLFEIVLTKYTHGTIFLPLFGILSLLIIYPYFKRDEKFVQFTLILGLVYDLVFSSVLFLNLGLYFTMSFVVIFLEKGITNTFFNINLSTIILIVLYRTLQSAVIWVFGVYEITILSWFESVYSSLLINAVFVSILYVLTNKIARRFKIKKVR